MTIDGTDGEGFPGVEIHWNSEGFVAGFTVKGNGTTIEGVAIGDFELEAIAVEANNVVICNSYLGTDLSGAVAASNEVGVWVGFGYTGTRIGSGCASGGNVISGNEWVGVVDDGSGTEIGSNLIGVGVGGGELPNSTQPAASFPGGGVLARGGGTTIGGPGEGNVIAYNENEFDFGGGVLVQSASVAIRRNSIFANDGKGIYFWFAVSPPVPTLEGGKSVEGDSTTIEGSLDGAPETTYAIDLFANGECDKVETGFEEFTFAGEGEEYLGSATVNTDALGVGEISISVPVQPEGTILTATATEGNSTSEFSECLEAPAVTPKPPDPGPPSKPGQPPVLFLAPPPAPENGEKVVVAPKAGTVFVTTRRGKKVKLEAGQTIPVGSIVDATRGKVTLTSVNRKGETQTAVFFGGVFLVQQQEGSGLVVLKLRGALNCGKAARSGRGAGRLERGGKKSRKLWGSGKGNFRTEGNNGSATVRGTIWLTEDRCSGTFFKVNQGVVTIRDFGANETFQLGKGKSYLATP